MSRNFKTRQCIKVQNSAPDAYDSFKLDQNEDEYLLSKRFHMNIPIFILFCIIVSGSVYHIKMINFESAQYYNTQLFRYSETTVSQ
jgi:hypothetical protein